MAIKQSSKMNFKDKIVLITGGLTMKWSDF